MNFLKSFLLSFSLFAGCLFAFPQGFVYYGSLHETSTAAHKGENLSVKVAFLTADNSPVFVELHDDLSTDNSGMFKVVVGSGQPTLGSFSDIDWDDASLMLSFEITREDGSVITDLQPLVSSPKALGAQTASTLVSKAVDSKRYKLAVDDEGNLSTVMEKNDIIPIPEGFSKMIFHDEFDYEGLPDPTFWSYEKGYVRGGEMQCYTEARMENAYVKDGLLHIVTLNDNWTDDEGTTHPVTSASVITKDKVKFTYGRVDIRAKLPICLGSWPALWMMPNDDVYGYWPNSGEIDIIEHVGFNPYTIYFTAHCAEQNGENNKYHGSTSVPTCTSEFHIYSFEWSENRLDWYVDGRRKWTVVKNSNTWRGWPYNRDFYLIMNTAFGGSWGGQRGVDLEALPITFEIDYVRVFQ